MMILSTSPNTRSMVSRYSRLRFESVYTEYANAPDVTRKRLYLETIERVFGDVDKIIIDESVGGQGGQGVVPYLPLNELRKGGTN